MEVISEDTLNPARKLLIAKTKQRRSQDCIRIEKFGFVRKTLKRSGDALVRKDADRLIAALSGRGSPRNLKLEACHSKKFVFPDLPTKPFYVK